MRSEERVTVQGPVKKPQPDGMSHGGGGTRGGGGSIPMTSGPWAAAPQAGARARVCVWTDEVTRACGTAQQGLVRRSRQLRFAHMFACQNPDPKQGEAAPPTPQCSASFVL